MSTSTVTAPTQLRRRAALAQLEAEELAELVAELRSSSRSKAKLERALAQLEALSARMQITLQWSGGLTVSQSAERLHVSEPTVRKWLAEGLLKPIEGRKPVEISQRSVIDVERILQGVRDAFPTYQWTKALAAYMHDRDLLSQPSVVKGIEQFKRGEFVER
jgi:DNA-binding CsgD family transcriptional regulator